MASKKPDMFTRCFRDFIKYLNVVEPYYMQSGILNARISFRSDDFGILHFSMRDLLVSPDPFDFTRYSHVFNRAEKLVRDLNSCHSFADEAIEYSFNLFDEGDELRYGVIRHG